MYEKGNLVKLNPVNNRHTLHANIDKEEIIYGENLVGEIICEYKKGYRINFYRLNSELLENKYNIEGSVLGWYYVETKELTPLSNKVKKLS